MKRWWVVAPVAFLLVLLGAEKKTKPEEAANRPMVLSSTRMPPRLLRTLARNPDGYDPGRASFAADILLGDLLFHSPHTLGPKAQRLGVSCQTCHTNGSTNADFFLPGVSDRPGNFDPSTAFFREGANDGIANAVNIPSLRGVRFTGPYGRDGRTASLAEFVQQVVTGEFGGKPLSTPRLSALVHYLQELDFLPNDKLDGTGRLTRRTGQAAKRGEIMFRMPRAAFDGESCASCHIPSSFFRDGKVHRHRSGQPASPYSLDDGYVTSTLLNIAETAPYFHDGRFATLAAVVSWYNREYTLGLTSEESADLTAYLEAVGSTMTREDDRPLGRKLAENFAYLALLVKGEARDDREIWIAAIDAVSQELTALEDIASLQLRVRTVKPRLLAVRERCVAGGPLPLLREEMEQLRAELTRSASDWAGVVAPSRKAPRPASRPAIPKPSRSSFLRIDN